MCDFCEEENKIRLINDENNGFLNITDKEVSLKHFRESEEGVAEITTPYGTLIFSGIKYCPMCGRRFSQ